MTQIGLAVWISTGGARRERQKTCRSLMLSSPSNKTLSILSWERLQRGSRRRAWSSWGEKFTAACRNRIWEGKKNKADFFILEREWHSFLWSERKLREQCGGGKKQRERQQSQWKKTEREAEVREILLSKLRQDRMWHVEGRKRKPDRYRLVWLLLLKTCLFH